MSGGFISAAGPGASLASEVGNFGGPAVVRVNFGAFSGPKKRVRRQGGPLTPRAQLTQLISCMSRAQLAQLGSVDAVDTQCAQLIPTLATHPH